MLPSSHSRSGGSRRTRTLDYDYEYEAGDAMTRQQPETTVYSSHSRGRGILRNHNPVSDDSFSSGSQDSSEGSLSESEWAIADHKVPLAGGDGGEGGPKKGRASRRGSLNSSLEGSGNFKFKMKSGAHNPFNNPFLELPAPQKPYKPPKKESKKQKKQKKKSRRSSLSDAPSHDSFNDSIRSIGRFRRRSSMEHNAPSHDSLNSFNDSTQSIGRFRRRSSMEHTTPSHDSFNSFNDSTQSIGRFRRRGSMEHETTALKGGDDEKKSKKTSRRSSISDAPSNHDSLNDSFRSFGRFLRSGGSTDEETKAITGGGNDKKSRKKSRRRSSLSDAPSNNDSYNSFSNSFNSFLGPMEEEAEEEVIALAGESDVEPLTGGSDMSDVSDAEMIALTGGIDVSDVEMAAALTGFDDMPTTVPLNFGPKKKMGRRSSMGDTPSSYKPPEPLVPQPPPPPTQSTNTAKPRGILRRSSMEFTDTSSDDGSMRYSMPTNAVSNEGMPLKSAMKSKMPRRGSMNDVVTTLEPPMPLKSAMKGSMPRRGSMNDVVTTLEPPMPLKSAMKSKMPRRGSMNDVVTTLEPPMPLKSAMKGSMPRRGSMNDVVTTLEPPMPLKSAMKSKMPRRGSMNDVVTTLEPPMPLKSAMKGSMPRRGSMNDVVTTLEPPMPLKSAMKGSMPRRGSMNDVVSTLPGTTVEPVPNEGWQMPPRSILRRGSISDVATEPSTSSLPYRVVPTKMGRGVPLNDAPNTPLNDSSSMMSGMVNSKRSTRSDGPKSALKPPKSTGTASYHSTRTAALNDITGPPLADGLGVNDGLMGMGGGYCVPLKSTSERNTRSNIKGKEVEQSPLSTSGRSISDSRRSSMSDSRRSYRSNRTASSYYTDRSTSSHSGISSSSIPVDVYDAYQDSMISHLGGRGSTRSHRSAYGSEVSSVNTFDTNDQSVSQKLDEMERSTRCGKVICFDDSWSINNLAADQSQSDHNAATTLFQNHSHRSRATLRIPDASLDGSNSSILTGSRDESLRLMKMEGDNWDDEDSEASFCLEDDVLGPSAGPSTGRRGSMQVNELKPRPSRRVSSLEFDGESAGFGNSSKSITWEDQSLGASNGQLYGSNYGGPRQSRQSSLTWDEASIGLTSSKKSLTWEDDSLAPPDLARRSSREIEDGSDDDLEYLYGYELAEPDRKHDSDNSLGDFAQSTLQGIPVSMSNEDSDSDSSMGDFAAAMANEDSDGSMGDFVASATNQDSSGSLGDFARGALSRPAAPLSSSDSDSSMGDFAQAALSRPGASLSSSDSDSSMGDFAQAALSRPAASLSSSDSDSSLGDFAQAALSRPQATLSSSDSDSSLGDFAQAALPRPQATLSSSDSDSSLGDFAAAEPSGSQKPSFSRMQGSDRSLGDFVGGVSDSDGDSFSDESDGLIRDDELFQDALSHMVESSTPKGFQRNASRRGSVGDYTLSLSGKGGNIPDLDRSEKSLTFSRRGSLSHRVDASTRSGSMSMSQDSFNVTAEELGIYNPSKDKDFYAQQFAMMQDGNDDGCSFMSASSEYDSSSFYESDEEKERRVKEGLMWGLGTMGVGALVGWLAKLFRKATGEDDVDAFDLETIHDELGQSICQSVLDESVNFTGSEQLWGWASLGDGGASAELVVSALHLPGTETAIISAATGAAAPTTSTAAGAAAVAATTNTMAVTAAGNVGAIAVTTSAVISQSAVAVGAGAGLSGVVSGAGAAASGALTALGLGTGSSASAAAVMGSAMGALAVAGTTYYSAAGTNLTSVDPNMMNICPHLNPENQTTTFRLTLDVSGMEGSEEAWGWMPFSDGVGANSTSPELLKELWEELFASSYNNITNYGCNEWFERNVLDANLTSSIHTGSSDGFEGFLETEWDVTVSCWPECPNEPLFGTELRRLLEPETAVPTTSDTNSTLDANTTLEEEDTKFFISELDFRTLFETQVYHAAGWELTVEKIDFGDGNYVAIPNLHQESSLTETADESTIETLSDPKPDLQTLTNVDKNAPDLSPSENSDESPSAFDASPTYIRSPSFAPSERPTILLPRATTNEPILA